MLETNIYDYKMYFAISFNGKVHFILEPDKWNKITNHLSRSSSDYGFWSDFIEDKYGMLFTYDSDNGITGGAQIILDIYNESSENTVYFSIGYIKSNTPILINEWSINLNTIEYDFGGIYASVEKMPFQAKLQSRMSAPCTINAYKTMDGALLTPISSWQLRLHSKTLSKTSIATTSSPQISNEYADGGGNKLSCIVTPDQSTLSVNELYQVFTKPIGLFNTTFSSPDNGLTSALYIDGVSNYNSSTSGILSVKFSGTFYMFAWGNNQEAGIVGATVGIQPTSFCFTATPRLVVQRFVNSVLTVVSTYVGATVNIDFNSENFQYPSAPPLGTFNQITNGGDRLNFNRFGDVNFPITFSETFDNIQIQQNDNIYVDMLLLPIQNVRNFGPLDWNGLTFGIFDYRNSITYTQLTSTPASTAIAYRAIDILNQMIENITGQKNAVISDFFNIGGNGYNFLFLNGYSIRNFGANIYQPVIDFKNFYESLQSIFCLGNGVRKINNVENLVIEYAPDFFKNRTIEVFEDTFVWKNSHNGSICYNKVELGFNKYEGLNIIQQDEFCTKAEYLFQYLKIQDNIFSKLSNIIASGYLIEEQRRNQFSLNSGQSLTNDNDIFIIATNEPCIFNNIAVTFNLIDGAADVVFGLSSMSLNIGDKFEVSNGPNSGIVFTIGLQYPGYPRIGSDRYYITPNPASLISVSIDQLTITVPSPNQIFSERNQPFEICTGVTDPSTIYNGRISMEHILYNWRPILGVSLSDISANSNNYLVSQIVTTLVRMNALFTSKFISTEPNKGNVGNLTTIEFANKSVRNYLNSAESIYTKVACTFQVKVGWNIFDKIRKALNGELQDQLYDYGGIVAKDDLGKYWFVHIIDIQYNPVQQIATIKAQKVRPATILA